MKVHALSPKAKPYAAPRKKGRSKRAGAVKTSEKSYAKPKAS